MPISACGAFTRGRWCGAVVHWEGTKKKSLPQDRPRTSAAAASDVHARDDRGEGRSKAKQRQSKATHRRREVGSRRGAEAEHGRGRSRGAERAQGEATEVK